MDKAELIRLVRDRRDRLDKMLAHVPAGRMEEPGVDGDWTVKDVVAHIVWHEQEMVRALSARSLEVGSEMWDQPTEQRNNTIYEQNRGRSVEDVLAEYEEVLPPLLHALE
jgi:uncharacterized protein (TIGR03083 family)